MTSRSLNCLVHAATAAQDSYQGLVNLFLRGQKGKSCVHITGHLIARRCEILVLSILAATEAAEVQCERVISGRAQHHSECVVNLPIRVALMEQEDSGSDFPG